MSIQFIIGQHVRIIGRPELLTIGAIRDGLLFIGDRWWPAWMATGAACAGEAGSGGAAVTDDQQGGQRMHIENDELLMWIGETLEQMAQEQGMIVTKCPHCALPVRFPLVARQSDIDLFAALIHSAQEVMQRYGITGDLLADIRAECLIAIAKKDRHD